MRLSGRHISAVPGVFSLSSICLIDGSQLGRMNSMRLFFSAPLISADNTSYRGFSWTSSH